VRTFYLTFSYNHPLCDNFIEIEAVDIMKARMLAFNVFGAKWSFVCDKKSFESSEMFSSRSVVGKMLK
jgi:hypothetical protein